MAIVQTVRERHLPNAQGAWVRAAGVAYGVSAIGIMWLFWAAFVIFLCSPRQLAPYLPFPTVDIGGQVETPARAAMIDLGLIVLFGLQHSVMARPGFKAWWTKTVHPAFERATYVHAANIVLILLVVLWQPIPGTVWDINVPVLEPAIWVLFALGWITLLAGALSFGLRDLLGLAQIRRWCEGKSPAAIKLKTSWLYRLLEHPMYVGLLVGVWATPHMTVGHALLALGFTLYVLVGMHYEQRDLTRTYGNAYRRWRTR